MTTTSALLLLADQQRPRTKQQGIGMSDLGSCRKRTGYKLAGVAPVNPVGSVQAVMGSAIHDMVASILNSIAKPGDLVEHEVTFAGIPGHVDRYHGDEQKVVDTKTTSSRWMEHVKLHGPDHGQVWQVSGYAAALIKAGYPVQTIQIDFLARDTGEEYVWSKPFDPQDVRDALNWLRTVRDADLNMLPRDYDPESVFCRGCPFGGLDGGICWEGHVPDRDFRSVLYIEDPDAAKWAQQLWDARNGVKPHKKAEAQARGALTAVVDPNGQVTKCGDFYIRVDARGAMKFVSGPREIEISA
jgi:PD-(D/E)XK nuclease superfamily protein